MEQLLKEARGRSVVRRGNTVLKRFQRPGLLGPLHDRFRARREFELLAHLFRAGVNVPRPLGIRASAAGWEVSMAWIAGARTLEAVYGQHAQAATELAPALGRLLAGLHAATVDHPDLHPGNVLVDASRALYLIDLHAARRRRRLSERQHQRDLLAFFGHLRELTPPPSRAEFVRAWSARLQRNEGPRMEAKGLLDWLEAKSPADRRRRVERCLERWTRPSGRVRALQRHGLVVLERRPGVAVALWPAPVGPLVSPTRLTVSGRTPDVLAHWRNAARLAEHRIPVARPALLNIGSDGPWATFEIPTGARPSTDRAQVERLAAQLEDRGLPALETPQVLLADGGPLFAPPPSLGGM